MSLANLAAARATCRLAAAARRSQGGVQADDRSRRAMRRVRVAWVILCIL